MLAFPGIFRGVLDARVHHSGQARYVTDAMKVAAAHALAGLVKNPTVEKIIPGVFEKGLSDVIAKAVIKATRA